MKRPKRQQGAKAVVRMLPSIGSPDPELALQLVVEAMRRKDSQDVRQRRISQRSKPEPQQ